MNRASIISGVLVTIATVVSVPPAFAADRFINDGARSSNTYQTYHSGKGGCVEDLGYGRVRDGCGGE
jgi:hypothetical protein